MLNIVGGVSTGAVPVSSAGGDLVSAIHAALENAPQGVVVVDVQEKILAANDSAYSMFGYEPGQLVGKTLDVLLPTSAGPQGDLLSTLWRRSEGRVTVSRSPVIGVRQDGSAVPIEVGAGLLGEGHTYYIVANMIDISDRLDLEARLLATSNEQLGFQRLIADIAARLVQVAPDEVDAAMTDSLREVAEALQVERVVVWQVGRGESTGCRHPLLGRATLAVAPRAVPRRRPAVGVLERRGWRSVLVHDGATRSPIRSIARRCGVRALLSADRVSADAPGRRPPRHWRARIQLDDAGARVGARDRRTAAAGCRASSARRWPARAVRRRSTKRSRKSATCTTHRRRPRARHRRRHRAAPRGQNACASSRPIVSESPTIKRALAQVEQVAPTPATVLLLGETGAGKEVFAQAIHDLSPRHNRQWFASAAPPFRPRSSRASCSAASAARTPARCRGRSAASKRPTSRRCSSTKSASCRWRSRSSCCACCRSASSNGWAARSRSRSTSASSPPPTAISKQAVDDGTFREDLFYRLNVFPIVVPPLRERVEDIPGLVWAFVDEFSTVVRQADRVGFEGQPARAAALPWPGNVRELRNVIERAVILATGRASRRAGAEAVGARCPRRP